MLYKEVVISISLFVLQAILMQGTNTKEFSLEAYVKNVTWSLAILYASMTRNLFWLLVPISVSIALIWFTRKGVNFNKYMTTKYLYNDYFEIMVKISKANKNYSEGNLSGMIPFDILDHSDQNVKSLQTWALKQYNSRSTVLTEELVKRSQLAKFSWIIEQLKITKASRVLDIGFGKLDLMLYILEHTGATVEGLNISIEHVKNARAHGFKAYHLSMDEIHKHLSHLGSYDVIITNGSLEYLFQPTAGSYESNCRRQINTFLQKSIVPLLKTGGRWYTSTLHLNYVPKGGKEVFLSMFYRSNRVNNLYCLTSLCVGNEGGYPFNGHISAVAKENGLKVICNQNRTNDYLVASVIWMRVKIDAFKRMDYSTLLTSVLHHICCWCVAPNYAMSFLCYFPTRNLRYSPWTWQFLQQSDGYTPTTLYWIIMQKP